MQKTTHASTKKVRTGDRVIVIAGNSKGQVGLVKAKKGDYVYIEGVQMQKKAVRPTQQNPKGGFVEIEAPIHISNVCLCDEQGTALKVKVQTNEQGERELYYVQDGKRVTYRSIKRAVK